MRIVRRYVGVSAVTGLISVPVLDVAALGGVHVALIRDLTEYYGGEFSEHAARSIVIAIGTSLIPASFGSIVGQRALRAIPFITHGAGLVILSASSAVVSYSLGLVFIRHFEAGGTLQNFDLKNLHRTFAQPAS